MLKQVVEDATLAVAHKLAEAASQDMILSVKRVAELTGVSEGMVRDWIRVGRKVPGTGRTARLRIIDGLTDSGYRVRRNDLTEFLNYFPSIRL